MKIYRVVSAFAYLTAWVLCVVSGANGYSWLPVFLTAALVVGQLTFLRKINYAQFTQDTILIGYGVVLGFLMEAVFLTFGLVSYATPNTLSPLLPPAWVCCLYFLFTLTYNHSLRFLNFRWFFPFVFGFLGGPMSYYAGSRLGAVTIDPIINYVILGLFWGLYLSVMILINRKLQHIIEALFDRKRLLQPLTVFFDPVCPICNREFVYLKTRKQTGSVVYENLASRKEFERKFKQVSYLDAMKEIHGLKESGTVLKGIDVFPELYARTDMHFIAVVLKAPFLEPIFRFVYRIWARYRLKNRCKIKPL